MASNKMHIHMLENNFNTFLNNILIIFRYLAYIVHNYLQNYLMFTHSHQADDFDLEAFLDISKKQPVIKIESNQEVEIKKIGKQKDKTDVKKKSENTKIIGKKTGHWDQGQNRRYHWFLQIYHNHFLKKHLRRVDRIFKIMETFLGTREAEQCRSHHQKMEKRHGNFRNILLHLRRHHYNSQETRPVNIDLEHNQIEIIDGLVQKEQLYQSQREEEKHEEEQMQKIKFEQEIQGLQEEGKFVENLMEDGYSKCIDLHGFFL